MDKTKLKKKAKKLWYFIWEDDSLLSWIVNIALAFLLIKFIVYPGLGLLLGTNFPVVAVVSGSMEHDLSRICIEREDGGCVRWDKENGEICGNKIPKQRINFDKFWEQCGSWYDKVHLTKAEFKEFPYDNGFNTGDIMVLFGTKAEKIKAGDIIVFRTSTRPDPIIHRVVKVWEDERTGKPVFQTKGDHNSGINTEVNEGRITSDRYIGRAVFRVPYLGWIKISAVKFINVARKTVS